jgi:glycosyltransferase involved in cell wall biosynthesis
MASIIFADSTSRYDGRDLERKALGGTESSLIRLARALARRGHDVTAVTNCDGVAYDQGVRWQPFGAALPAECDLYIPLQHPRLFGLVSNPRRLAVWVVWRGNNLKHYKQLPRMWWYRPVPVLMSLMQVRQYSPFLPRRNPHIVIPLGLPDDIRGFQPLENAPGPDLIFASNPTRNLHGIIRIWADQILPARPDGKLRVFGAIAPVADPWKEWSGGILPADLSDRVRSSIEIRTAAPRSELIAAMRKSRGLIYLGHKTEAFCLTLAEAQAMGVPCVVAPIAVLPERVIDGVTGFVRGDEKSFAAAALSLLNDDQLWRRQHEAALRLQQGLTWAEVAARFEHALLSDRLPTDRSCFVLPHEMNAIVEREDRI